MLCFKVVLSQGIYDKRQRTEHEMVHREQEMKQLQGWAQTVLNLINKFEDGLKELGPLAALEEADSRPGSPDEPLPGDAELTAVATARALTNRARDLTAHRQGIAKLRQHFSKVCSLIWLYRSSLLVCNWASSLHRLCTSACTRLCCACGLSTVLSYLQ